jgi:hypothetical protein
LASGFGMLLKPHLPSACGEAAERGSQAVWLVAQPEVRLVIRARRHRENQRGKVVMSWAFWKRRFFVHAAAVELSDF